MSSEIGVGVSATTWSGPRRQDFAATVTGLTYNPTFGDCAEIGRQLIADVSGYGGAEPSHITYQWETAEAGPIVGATTATYAPVAGLDGQALFCRVTPDGYPEKPTAAFIVRQSPPQAVDLFDIEIFDFDTGLQPIDLAPAFSGTMLEYSVSGGGATVDPVSGVAQIPTDVLTEGTTVIVTARNSGGSATEDFTVVVEAPGTIVELAMGANTLAGAGGIDAPAAATGIASAGGTNLVLSAGRVAPATDGVSSGTVIFDTGEEWVVTAEPSTYSAANEAEIEAAIAAIGTAGGATVKPRSGSYTWTNFTQRLCRNIDFTATVVIDGSEGPVFDHMEFENCQNVTLQNTEVNQLATNDSCVSLHGEIEDFTIDACDIHGTFRDPTADWSDGSYTNATFGITCVAGASGLPHGVTITNNRIYDVETGCAIVMDGGANGFTFSDNEVFQTREDTFKFSVSGTALTAPKNIERNVFYGLVGNPADADNPHVDIIQVISSAANNGLEMTNLVVRQNIAWQIDGYHGENVQGITQFEDGGNQVILKDPIITGNVMLLAGNHHLTLQGVDGGIIANNTLMHPDSAYAVTSQGQQVNLTVPGGGTDPVVRDNLVERATIGVASSDNVIIGIKGATNSYATVFDGPDASPVTFDEVKTRYNMALNGPADRATTGARDKGDAGALGTGYGVFGAVRDSSGWSFDPAYEVIAPTGYTQNFVDNTGTGRFSQSGGVGGNETAFTLSTWIKVLTPVSGGRVMRVSGRSEITISTNTLSVLLKDTANSIRYNSAETGASFGTGDLHHLYVAADFANDTLDVEIDGVAVPMTVDPATFTGGTGLVDLDRNMGFLAMDTGASPLDAEVSDFTLFNSIVSNAVLYHGGTPPDPSAFATTPLVLFGGEMSLADWNAGTNLGSGGPVSANGTFALP